MAEGVTVIDRTQKIVLTVTILICISVISVVFFLRPKAETPDNNYIPPEFEEDAQKGIPEIPDKDILYSTMKIPITDGCCDVSMNAAPKLNAGRLDVYFTNSAESTVWLKLVIYNEAGNQIAESGILRNGEYVIAVELNENVTAGEELKAKILTYEPDTYYSLGSAGAILKVQ